jgi:hypothetical protein
VFSLGIELMSSGCCERKTNSLGIVLRSMLFAWLDMSCLLEIELISPTFCYGKKSDSLGIEPWFTACNLFGTHCLIGVKSPDIGSDMSGIES